MRLLGWVMAGICLAGNVGARSAIAGDPAPASTKRQKIGRLFELTHQKEQLERSFEFTMKQLTSRPGSPAGFADQFQRRVMSGELLELITRTYEQVLDEAMLDALIAFYETEEGSRFGEKLPDLFAEAQKVREEWARKVAAELMFGRQEPDLEVRKRYRFVVGDLKHLISAQSVWRQTDPDNNGLQDYWTRDIAGFHSTVDGTGEVLNLVDVTLARADRAGMQNYPDLGGEQKMAPKNGYWFKVMKESVRKGAIQTDEDGDGKAWTCRYQFAWCAYPARYEPGFRTFIANEEGSLYSKDLGSDVEGIDEWPAADPTVNGWTMEQ